MSTALTFSERNLGILLNTFGGFDLERVELLSELVDETGLLPYMAKWREEDRANKRAGGRPPVLGDRTVMVLMLGMALLSKPIHVTLMAEAVTMSMTPGARAFLGLPEKAGTEAEWYDRIWRALHTTLDTVDAKPMRGASRARLTPEQAAALKASRDPKVCAVKQDRLDFVTNTLLETTWRCIPREIRRKYKGNTSVDGTAVKAFGQRGHSKDGTFIGMEVDAGNWSREGDHGDNGKGKPSLFGFDTHLVVTMSNDADFEPEFPIVALGIAFEKPGFEVAENTVKMYESLGRRGHAAGLIVGDLVYFGGQSVEKFHGPLQALGHDFLTDYRIDQLGNRKQNQGAILVEGWWYCPCMEDNLVNATVDLFAGKIDVDTWKRRIQARERYAAVAKGKPDADGYYRLTHPTVKGRSVCDPTRKHAPKFCTQKSVTFSPEVGLKSRQAIRFGTDKWLSTYGHGRNAVETFNAYAKDDSKQALGAQGRRRIRSYAAQYFVTAILVAAANMRKIRAFLKKQRVEAARNLLTGVTAPRRRDPALVYFRKRKKFVEDNDSWVPDEDDDPTANLLAQSA